MSSTTKTLKNQEMGDRISLVQKLAYSSGVLVNNLQAAAVPAMVVILNLGLGVSPEWVGIIVFVPRMVDALTDPIVGYISDNTRTRWGRRRPYIFVGALLAGVLFASMWQVPSGHSQNFYITTFIFAFICYFFSYSLFATPLVAFGYEMTPDYHERTRLHAFANTIGQLPWLGVHWFYAIMANKNYFADEAEGARYLSIYVGATICIFGVLPAIFCRERILPQAVAVGEPGEFWGRKLVTHISRFLGDFKSTLSCRPFMKLCAATFLVFNGYGVGISFTLYVLIYYVFSGDREAAGFLNGWFGMITVVSSIILIPLTGWIATKIGKRETLLAALCLSLVGYSLKWFGFSPDYPYLLLIACPFIACGIGTLFTLMNAMVGDVCDYDELQSHSRREGVFGAIYWWMVKIGMALAGLVAGILLEKSGFNVKLPEQSDSTLELIRLIDVVVPFVTTALAIWILSTYEITESKSLQIRQQLEERRGKLL